MTSTTEVVPNALPALGESRNVPDLSRTTTENNHHHRGNARRGNQSGSRGMHGSARTRGDRGTNTNGHRGRTTSIIENRPAPSLPPPPGLGGGGSLGDRLTKDAETKEGEGLVKGQDGQEDEVEAEVCFICASPVVYNAIAPCNHRTCHICALRLRALYKTRACAHCRVSGSYRIT